MDNSARDRYLRGMGISQWLPRKPLRGAKPSDLTTVRQEPPAEAAAQEIMARVQPPAKPDTKALDKEVHEPDKTRVEPIAPPRFRLEAILFAGQCLIINDITSESEAVNPAGMTRLLNDILIALGVPALQERVVRNFSWPILRNPLIDQSSAVAKDATLAFINQQLTGQAIRLILLMGENAQKFVMPDANNAAGTRLCSDCQVIVTRSLSEMIMTPLCKRDAWTELQDVQLN